MLTNCDYCLKRFSKSRGRVLTDKHNFCCKEHFTIYRRLYPEEFTVLEHRNVDIQHKLKKFAKEREELLKGE